MQPADAFTLVAEIAVAILGFSGIVVVLKLKTIKQFGSRLGDMILATIGALFFALTPIPLLVDDAPGNFAQSAWTATFAIFLIGHTIYLVTIFFRSIRKRNRANPYIVGPFAIAGSIVATAVAREAISGSGGWSNYTWGLVFLTITASYLFARMVWMSWRAQLGDA